MKRLDDLRGVIIILFLQEIDQDVFQLTNDARKEHYLLLRLSGTERVPHPGHEVDEGANGRFDDVRFHPRLAQGLELRHFVRRVFSQIMHDCGQVRRGRRRLQAGGRRGLRRRRAFLG